MRLSLHKLRKQNRKKFLFIRNCQYVANQLNKISFIRKQFYCNE